MRREIVSCITLTFLLMGTLTLAFNTQTARADGTQVEIVAPTTDIPVSTKFNVDINVSDVTNLDAWQIKLYYNETVLNWVNITLPPGHVFDGRIYGPGGPVNLRDPIARATYIMYSESLQGYPYWIPRFNGSGILCRIFFEAKAAGTSNLVFSRPLGCVDPNGDTWLWNGEAPTTEEFWKGDIPFTAVEDSVTVVGVDTRAPSAMSVNAYPRTVKVNNTVTVTGAVNATVADGTPVYIEYSPNPWWVFKPLATAYTVDSQYSYTWTLDEVGWLPYLEDSSELYDIRVRWGGDDSYKPATSAAITVKVTRVLGDVNGDGKADGKDIAIVGKAFGSYPTHPRWNFLADLNSDNKIDGRDITFVAKDFGKHT